VLNSQQGRERHVGYDTANSNLHHEGPVAHALNSLQFRSIHTLDKARHTPRFFVGCGVHEPRAGADPQSSPCISEFRDDLD
jgi:hypothetical protein